MKKTWATGWRWLDPRTGLAGWVGLPRPCSSPLDDGPKTSVGKVTEIATQYPDLPFAYFDSVILPRHDLRKLAKLGPVASQQKNMILTKGALHGVSKSSLQIPNTSTTAIPPAMLHRLSKGIGSREVFALFIGHPTSQCPWSLHDAEILAKEMLSLSKVWGHYLLVEFSQKTPALWKKGILKTLASEPTIQKRVWAWDGQGNDPHMEILSLADRFVITADDPITVSEALTTEKPVYVHAPERCVNGPLKDFHRILRTSGHTRRFRLVHALDRESVSDPYAGIGTWPAWAPFLPSGQGSEVSMVATRIHQMQADRQMEHKRRIREAKSTS
ncbi:mitochondrial fission ELM1-domain-containing protein [Piptocephalis cylindrospora]|uniref:Mitochondrial fission ELM1-domain-containing protein n=1 Tax=Piptocephalis cylindrospora TaxID=1907219 RepID=A0A4P9XYT5_9FUNG|nr:mitochondrial fission ELM1-domain-containing protein [Piptocephalis cylindrospora]|eukprot:RKP11606.1 mitochondrial fission ELM1-domain-containing protein [Piptocephalis cylindrospora]